MAGAVLKLRTQPVQCTSTVAIFYPMTGWMATILIVRLRALLALVNKSTNLQLQLAIQTADTDPNSANTPVAIGNVVSSVGRSIQDVDVTQAGNGAVNTKMWFRLGVMASSTGATVESGTAALQASFRDSL